jgi:acetoin utilization protein AcuB
MSALTVRAYMTPTPFTIGAQQTLAVAQRMMSEHAIRHLPVLDGGKLVGVVTQRDLQLVQTLRDVDPEKLTVDEAMSPDPYTISPGTSLEWVAMAMSQHKYGSVIVVDHGKVVGVFTTVDALRALQELLEHSRRGARSGASQ